MRRLALLGVLGALVAGGCGGSPGTRGQPGSQPQPVPAAGGSQQIAVREPTPEQLAVREELLREIAAGTYKCWCNAAARAQERVESGKAKKPPRDQLVSALP
jgi:ABC-type phosphate transport system substrate-binding protein